MWASQVVLVVKNLPANAGSARDGGLIPGSGRSPGVGNGNPLQYSCLEKSHTQEPGGAIVMGLQRVGHEWAHRTHSEFWRNTKVSIFRPLPTVPAVVWINARFTLDPSALVNCLLFYTHHIGLPWKPLLTLPAHWFCKGPISICLILHVHVVLKYFFYFSQKPGAAWCEDWT